MIEIDKLTDEWYYADREYLTQSMLGWTKAGPAYFKKMFFGKQKDDEEESYYKFGKAIHARLLEPDIFPTLYYVLKFKGPSNAIQKKFCEFLISTNEEINDSTLKTAYKLSYSSKSLKDDAVLKKAQLLYKENKEYVEERKKNKGKIFLTQSEFEKIRKIENNIHKHKRASDLLFGYGGGDDFCDAYNEQIILFKSKNGTKMKSKIDRFIINYNLKEVIVIEFKTHSVQREDQNMAISFKKSFEEFDYDLQFFFYILAISNFMKKTLKINPTEFDFKLKSVVAKSNFDNEVRVFSINDKYKLLGAKKFEEELDAFYHYKVLGYDYPYNVNDELEEEIKP